LRKIIMIMAPGPWRRAAPALSQAVVDVCPRPSTSPWSRHHGRRGDVLGRRHTTTTAGENRRWPYPIFGL